MEKGRPSNRFSGIIESFSQLQDPRIERSKRYPLIEILFLTVSAVISGFEGWEEIEDFGHEKQKWLRKYLAYENGIPSHDTINRVISMINHRAFEECFMDWATMNIELPQGTLISIDGKKLRSSATKKEQQTPRRQGGKSAIHLVHAWCHEFQICLGQYQVAQKSNEITAIPALLDFLELEGCLVSIDAMGCQKSIASKVLENKADYIFGLKGNQEKLSMGVLEAFEAHEVDAVSGLDEQQSEKKEHGRKEKRVCRVLPSDKLPKWVEAGQWAGLCSIIEIQSERKIIASGRVEQEVRYYISSLEADAKTFNHLIRSHWNVENQLHWSLDVQFGEDASRKRIRNAAQNFSTIRKMALNLIKANTEKISVNRKRNKCALSDEYRSKMLGF
jgi:predicted transposase YbfD/YdcC